MWAWPLAGVLSYQIAPWIMEPLPVSFFAGPTLAVARALLGCWLVREDDGCGRVAGRIVETEGYPQEDPAFAGWGVIDETTGRLLVTPRTRPLFGPPGRAYVYQVYGRHWLLNVTTEPAGVAGAVLIRALEPTDGQAAMRLRRGTTKPRKLTAGPGMLTEALAIDRQQHGHDLTAPPLYLARPPGDDGAEEVVETTRIGLRYGADLAWRFLVKDSPYVSKPPVA